MNQEIISQISAKRSIHLDIIAGIMIIYMVLYHCSQWSNTTNSLIMRILERGLFFFMPWFFFKAGLFFKKNKKLNAYIQSSSKRLIIPFLVYTILAMPVYTVSLILINNFNFSVFLKDQLASLLYCGSVPANLPLWFLPTLFAVRIIAKVTSIINIKLCLLGGGIAMVLNYINFHYPLWIPNICSGLFFFSLAYLLNNIQYRKVTFIISTCIYIAAFAYPSIVDLRCNSLHSGNYALWLIFSTCGCIVFNNIFLHISTCSLIFKPFQIAGENSMFIYASHWIIFFLLKISLTSLEISLTDYQRFILYITVMTLSYALFFVFHKRISHKKNICVEALSLKMFLKKR